MVVLDLDGTLLNENKELSPKSSRVLAALRAKNIEIVVATGRRYSYVKTLFENIGFPLTILCSSGTLVRNTLDDRKITVRYLDRNLFYDIVRMGREHSLHPLLHVDHSEEGCDFLLEFEKDAPCYHSYLTDKVNEYRVVGDFLAYKGNRVLLMCFMDEEAVLKKFEACLRKKYSNSLHSHIMTTLKRIGPVLEIMNPNGTKWKTLLEYAATLNIGPREIVTMGDDNNDIEMIKNSGLGIAMKNATEQVKSQARVITRYSNNEEGAARTLIDIFNLSL
jgi:Cof subfamily protein (haloacid dehalogenase superfamily)